MSLESLWRGWKRAIFSGRTETLEGVVYYPVDGERYWTPWKEGRLIPDRDFRERLAEERTRGPRRRSLRRTARESSAS